MQALFIIVLLCVLIVLSLAVAYSDYHYRRIPNVYLVSALVFALLIFIAMTAVLPVSGVARGFLFSILGMLMGFIFLFPGYLLKQMAAGDVKFMMIIGFYLGPKGCALSLLTAALVGGLWALVLAWRIGGLGHMFYNMKYMARSAYLSGFKDMGWDLRNEKAVKMPYGVALAAGAILVASWQLNLYVERILQIHSV
jgi:prepilin peptidase CpaA